MPVKDDVVQSLYDKAHFKEALGKERNYPNFLEFFQREINQRGVEGVLKEYVLREEDDGDECAESMLVRLFGGLLHPFIHFGFAIEFNQPALIAEALAQTAIHDDWTGPRFLLPAEKAAGGIGKPGNKTVLQLLEESRRDSKLANSVSWEDGNKLRDGVLKRAPDEMINLAAQFTVSEEQVQEKFAEMVDVAGRIVQSVLKMAQRCTADRSKSTIRAPPNTLQRPSNSTSFTSMQSTLPSSTTKSWPCPSSTSALSSVSWSGKDAWIS